MTLIIDTNSKKDCINFITSNILFFLNNKSFLSTTIDVPFAIRKNNTYNEQLINILPNVLCSIITEYTHDSIDFFCEIVDDYVSFDSIHDFLINVYNNNFTIDFSFEIKILQDHIIAINDVIFKEERINQIKKHYISDFHNVVRYIGINYSDELIIINALYDELDKLKL